MTVSKMESECRTLAAESFKCLEGHGADRAKAKVTKRTAQWRASSNSDSRVRRRYTAVT